QRGTDARADVAATAAEVRRIAPARAAHHRALEEGSLAARPTLCADARAALGEIAEAGAPAHVVFYTAPLTPAYRRHQQTRGCGLHDFAAGLAARRANVSYFDDRALSGFTDG